jgi:hypothetical protein
VSWASIAIGIAGVLVSAAAKSYIRVDARRAWVLGLAGLFPAWLFAFLTLIDPASRSVVDIPLPPRALMSSGAGLLGVIATDYYLRRSGGAVKPMNGWMLGWVALLPAWLIAALG